MSADQTTDNEKNIQHEETQNYVHTKESFFITYTVLCSEGSQLGKKRMFSFW